MLEQTLRDKNVLVIGGTSGIGLAAARIAKLRGASVVITGADQSRSKKVAEEHGFDGWRGADVTDPEALQRTLADIDRVDHLAVSAGTFVSGKVVETDVNLLRLAFEERIWAAVHIIKSLDTKLSNDASITLVSGALADRPNAHGTAVLGAAVAASEALARGLALELAPRRVNAVSPGPIDTPLYTKALGDGRDAYFIALKKTLPLNRIGSAEEAGAAIVFMMTNGWMNGSVLNIDGGSRLI